MAKIYLTYGAVPELAPLSSAKRLEVIRASGGRFGKTPQFMRVWWLGVALILVLPLAVGLLVYFSKAGPVPACWFAIGSGLAGYATWFHVRTSCLRPHIRAYLADTKTPGDLTIESAASS
jgi:hypothetical protein